MKSCIARILPVLSLILTFAGQFPVQGLIVTRTSDSVIYIDVSAQVWCSYASYRIVNNDGVNHSNLWVKIDSFTNGVIRLGGNDPGQVNIDKLGIGQTNTVYFYLRATNTTAVAQTHSVRVYRGRPDTGTQLTNQSFSLTVSSSGQNNSTKINSVSANPNPATVGGLLEIAIAGTTGQIGGANRVNFTPAVYTNWDAGTYQLVSSSIDVSGGNSGSYSNTLVVNFASSADTTYTARYWFRVLAIGATNTVSPLTTVSGGGGNYSHAAPPAIGVIPAILPATNQTVLTNFAGASQVYTNEPVTFTVRIINNSIWPIALDGLINTLPNGFAYLSNSAFFNGLAATNPNVSGQVLTWSERYDVPGGGFRDFTFVGVPTAGGFGTNSVVGIAGATLIDTTILTSDNSPGRAVVRTLLAPTAVNDATNTVEDSAITVAAPGVLANDSEPNGFPKNIVSFTQPTNGTVNVNGDGSFTYIPAPDFNGLDVFNYTYTNGNARSATASVLLTVVSVNDPPTIDPIAGLALNENAGEQTVNLSGISAGASDESTQFLSVAAFSDNPALVPDPVVFYTSPAATGSLKFTPAPGSNGVAVIKVVVSDNGGVSNGGVSAVTNTFIVSVGTPTTIWFPNETQTWTIRDAEGAPNVGHDTVYLTGRLDIQATPDDPFTIRLESLSGNAPGYATNFNFDATNEWTIAETTHGVMGFDPAKFLVDTTQFSNDLGGGVFSVVLASDSNSVRVMFLPNHAPTAAPVNYGRAWGTSMRIPIQSMVAGFTSDVDGDATRLAFVGNGTNNTAISTNANSILFAPRNNFHESFQYVVRDVRNYRSGDTIRTATNWITISVTNAVSAVRSIDIEPGGVTVRFAGVPGYAYAVERTTNLSGGNWEVVLTTNAPPGGVWKFIDNPAVVPAAYYRTRQY